MVTIDGSVLFLTQPIRGCGSPSARSLALPPSLSSSRAGLVCGAPSSRSCSSSSSGGGDGVRCARVSVWKVAAHAQLPPVETGSARAVCEAEVIHIDARARTHTHTTTQGTSSVEARASILSASKAHRRKNREFCVRVCVSASRTARHVRHG